MVNIHEDYQKCPIMNYYYFLGKKWTYPIIVNLDSNRNYSFEDFIHLTNRKMSRSMLSVFLKKATEFNILRKIDRAYFLTSLGMDLKKDFINIKKKLECELDIQCDCCSSRCIINHNRL